MYNYFIKIANLSQETAQGAIFIFELYISNSADLIKLDIQLISMVCILICSKMFDVRPLSLSTLHRISAHIYNNSMVLNTEKIILSFLNYNLFIRDKLIIDRVGIYLESVRFLIDSRDFDKFREYHFIIQSLF